MLQRHLKCKTYKIFKKGYSLNKRRILPSYFK